MCRRSSELTTVPAPGSAPSAKPDTAHGTVLGQHVVDDAAVADLDAEGLRRAGHHLGEPPLPPLWNDHDPMSRRRAPHAHVSITGPEPCDIGPTFVP